MPLRSGSSFSPSERRGAGRRRQQSLQCNLGEVTDISVSGMRVVGRRSPVGRFSITLETIFGPLTVEVEVAWTRRVGLMRTETGLRFVNLTAELNRRLTRISTAHQFVYGHVA